MGFQTVIINLLGELAAHNLKLTCTKVRVITFESYRMLVTVQDLLFSIGPKEDVFVLHQLNMVGEEDKSNFSNFKIEQLLDPFGKTFKVNSYPVTAVETLNYKYFEFILVK